MARRRAAAWLLVIPLMVAGSQVAHWLAYRLVYPDAHVRLRVLGASGHGYLAYAPLVLGIGIALELVAFVSVARDVARGRSRRAVPPIAFAVLPPLGFVLQEFSERWLAGAPFPWWMALQPTFRLGLLLQLPVAAAAYLAARMLLRLAEQVGTALRGRAHAQPVSVAMPGWSRSPASLVRGAVLAQGRSQRGPPVGFLGPGALALF
jgi:hypothetical protein